jgi:hypothetical protein
MARYEIENDRFIVPEKSGAFRMRDSAQGWYKRAESFETIQGYVLFARRMELCLRCALGASTDGREGLSTLTRDLLTVKSGYRRIKEKIRTDLGPLIQNASIADAGAGTGSILGFIEWAGLPYPKEMVLLEPNAQYYAFLSSRIEGTIDTSTRKRLSILSKEPRDCDNQPNHGVYVVHDNLTGNESQVHVINTAAQDRDIPVTGYSEAIIFVGVSKYYKPEEFRLLVENMQSKFYSPEGGVTAFNTQGKKDVLSLDNHSIERITYRLLKAMHQLAISGKPTLHNFYGRAEIADFPGKATVVHNFGDAIIVALSDK